MGRISRRNGSDGNCRGRCWCNVGYVGKGGPGIGSNYGLYFHMFFCCFCWEIVY